MKKRGKENFNKSREEIPLVINSYDDLFSNFDPRPYSHKALSKDFLLECQKASEDKKDDIELKFILDKNKRKIREEEMISKRLKEHFKKHFLEKKNELLRLRLIGIFWFLVGCLLTAITAILLEKDVSLSVNVMINLAHPAGWFFLWEGMAKILIHSKEKMDDYNFNRKLNHAKISFLSKK